MTHLVPELTEPPARSRPRLVQLADVFARYANFTLGGGTATISVMHHELVGRRGWLNDEKFALCFALIRVTPGTNLLAFCTAVGWLLRGMFGAIVALLAASIPCSLIVVVATALFSYWHDNHWAQAAIHGAIAAAVAITVKTCWTIAHPYFKGQARLRVILVSAVAFLFNVVLGISAIEVLLLAALIGALLPAART